MNRKYTPDENRTIVEMRKSGEMVVDIALRLGNGRTKDSVKHQIERLGLTVRRSPKAEAPVVKLKKGCTLRKCLACGEEFPSSWIGNRRCKPCTSSYAFQTSGSRFA